MRDALQAWREENQVQENAPNPDCDESLFGDLYVDTDSSRFDPLTANQADWARIQNWSRKMMTVMRQKM